MELSHKLHLSKFSICHYVSGFKKYMHRLDEWRMQKNAINLYF